MAANFDEAELLDRVEHDREFLRETVALLQADAPSLMANLRSALEAGDAAGVARHAHSLKGMLSNFCAPAAHGAACAVENLGKAGDLSAAPAAIGSLRELLDALIPELSAFAGVDA